MIEIRPHVAESLSLTATAADDSFRQLGLIQSSREELQRQLISRLQQHYAGCQDLVDRRARLAEQLKELKQKQTLLQARQRLLESQRDLERVEAEPGFAKRVLDLTAQIDDLAAELKTVGQEHGIIYSEHHKVDIELQSIPKKFIDAEVAEMLLNIKARHANELLQAAEVVGPALERILRWEQMLDLLARPGYANSLATNIPLPKPTPVQSEEEPVLPSPEAAEDSGDAPASTEVDPNALDMVMAGRPAE